VWVISAVIAVVLVGIVGFFVWMGVRPHEEGRIIGIRHLPSMSNDSPQSAQWTDKTLIDAELSPRAHEICAKKQAEANQLNFTVVLISPMRRTLQTALCLFQNHPNFHNIRFILLPTAMEMMRHPDTISYENQTNLDYYNKMFP